jgi:DNA-binding PadR family transcriptional regulator
VAGDQVQMFILGSLSQGEAHGYQLLARAKKWGVDDWAGFGAGSIYNALKTLQRRGLIVEQGTEQHGSYAPATIYAITPEGHATLLQMVRDGAVRAELHDPFDLVTAFLGLFPPEERQQIVATRIASIERRMQRWGDHYSHIQEHVDQGYPLDWVLAAIEKGMKTGEVALEWAHELLSRSLDWSPPPPLTRPACPIDMTAEPPSESAATPGDSLVR